MPTVIISAAGIAGPLALVIAFLTVSFYSLKTANQNPLKALRHE